MELRIISHTSIRINKVHKSIVGFDDSKLRREEELEALPREMVWMRPLAAQHVTISLVIILRSFVIIIIKRGMRLQGTQNLKKQKNRSA
jgi:hypothetical protein